MIQELVYLTNLLPVNVSASFSAGSFSLESLLVAVVPEMLETERRLLLAVAEMIVFSCIN